MLNDKGEASNNYPHPAFEPSNTRRGCIGSLAMISAAGPVIEQRGDAPHVDRFARCVKPHAKGKDEGKTTLHQQYATSRERHSRTYYARDGFAVSAEDLRESGSEAEQSRSTPGSERVDPGEPAQDVLMM